MKFYVVTHCDFDEYWVVDIFINKLEAINFIHKQDEYERLALIIETKEIELEKLKNFNIEINKYLEDK